MSSLTLDTKLARIADCARHAARDDLLRSVLHAYIACLTIEELCEAGVRTLDGPAELHGPIRTRLVRLGREGATVASFDDLAHRLIDLQPAGAKLRLRVDAMLSHLYHLFGPPTRQRILGRERQMA